ncbi:MAG: hypothetical protein GY774_27670 [Planctomycetes bacterium]|nr:hypothetical protein [Planctomycetota bacterium]
MAKITFSLAELKEILISNAVLPKVILRPKVEGEEIHFVVNTNLPFLQFIPLSLRYLNYTDNNAIFEISVVNSNLHKTINKFNLMSRLDVPEYIKIDFPKIYIDVNELLQIKNIRGILLKDIFYKDGEFTIVTSST